MAFRRRGYRYSIGRLIADYGHAQVRQGLVDGESKILVVVDGGVENYYAPTNKGLHEATSFAKDWLRGIDPRYYRSETVRTYGQALARTKTLTGRDSNKKRGKNMGKKSSHKKSGKKGNSRCSLSQIERNLDRVLKKLNAAKAAQKSRGYGSRTGKKGTFVSLASAAAMKHRAAAAYARQLGQKYLPADELLARDAEHRHKMGYSLFYYTKIRALRMTPKGGKAKRKVSGRILAMWNKLSAYEQKRWNARARKAYSGRHGKKGGGNPAFKKIASASARAWKSGRKLGKTWKSHQKAYWKKYGPKKGKKGKKTSHDPRRHGFFGKLFGHDPRRKGGKGRTKRARAQKRYWARVSKLRHKGYSLSRARKAARKHKR